MFRVSIGKNFTAYHYLIGGDWGVENERHSHPFRVEVELEGETLDEHNYLVDIVQIENNLNIAVNKYENKCLNDFPEFASQNPSIELFSKILCNIMNQAIDAANIRNVIVRLWESDSAWASYEVER
ncbi:MAG: 6-pyruvoyl tetrahydropterin synthase family protein [Anaerolineaceae bacterium]